MHRTYDPKYAFTHASVWEDLSYIYDYVGIEEYHSIRDYQNTRMNIICRNSMDVIDPDIESYIFSYVSYVDRG